MTRHFSRNASDCAGCDRKIAAGAPSVTIDGESYHVGCADAYERAQVRYEAFRAIVEDDRSWREFMSLKEIL